MSWTKLKAAELAEAREEARKEANERKEKDDNFLLRKIKANSELQVYCLFVMIALLALILWRVW